MKNFFTFIGFIFLILGSFGAHALASQTDGTIDPVYYTAKVTHDSSLFNLLPGSGTPIHITDTAVTGDAWGQDFGWVRFDPDATNHVSNSVANATKGQLSGYAWGEAAGWVNFGPFSGSGMPPAVFIDTSGFFNGYAWSQNFGWIQFDCSVSGACVRTDWRPPSVRGTSGGGGPTCQDPTADNFGGALPCTYPTTGGQTCQDPVALNFGGALPCTYPNGGNPTCQDPAANNFGNPLPCTYSNNGQTCQDPFALNYGSSGSCQYAQGSTTCQDPVANNFGGALPCTYPNGGNTTCQDPTADNFGGALPCTYPQGGGPDIIPVIEHIFDLFSSGAETPAANSVFKFLSIVGLLGALFAPLSMSELILLPARLWSLLLAVFGLKKRPWGTVYDSVTKQPLDPAYVILSDMAGKEIATAITDLDGRYGFTVIPGTYRIVAQKTNYLFPSKKLEGKTKDELYQDLYFGEPITITKEGELVAKNIPMDPLKFDWNEFTKSQQKLTSFYSTKEKWLRRISDICFVFGFTISWIALLAVPETYNIIIFGLYILVYIFRETGLKLKPFGGVVDATTNMPLSFAIVRVYSSATNTEITHKVADQSGRFYCLIPNGSYYVTVERKNLDGNYEKVFTSSALEIKKGYINNVFKI